MIVYNVTIKVALPIATDWLLWLKETHIPEVIATGCFTSFQIYHLLEQDESEGPTYTIQYFAESKALYNRYISLYAEIMRNKSFAAWGNQFIAFRSIMEIVN